MFCCSKYFPNHKLPDNLTATTDAKSALQGADFCLHAVPVQVSKLLAISFLLTFSLSKLMFCAHSSLRRHIFVSVVNSVVPMWLCVLSFAVHGFFS